MTATATQLVEGASAPSLAVGIVGPGLVAERHADAIRMLGHRLVGVVGRTPDRSKEAAARFATRAFSTLDEMLGNVDVVHVTGPNSVHRDHSIRALRHGIPVICEKPLALSPSDTYSMVQAAGDAGVPASTHLQRRYYRRVQEIREMVASGELGAPWYISVEFLQDWTARPEDYNWRMEPAEGGALRVVHDLVPHCADLAEFVTSDGIVSVQAQLGAAVRRVRPFPEANDYASVNFATYGGLRGTIVVSQIAHGQSALNLRVDCSEGAVAWSHAEPEVITVLRRDFAPHVRSGEPDSQTDVFARYYEDVYAAIAASSGPSTRRFPTFLDGHHQALICWAVGQSARTGQTQAVPPLDFAGS